MLARRCRKSARQQRQKHFNQDGLTVPAATAKYDPFRMRRASKPRGLWDDKWQGTMTETFLV
jgi:hypothetical protein